MMKEHFARIYEHVFWANNRVLDLLQDLSSDNERARKLFSHILAAEQVWMTRLLGRDSSDIPIWPDLSLDECSALMEMNRLSYRQFLDSLTEEAFDQEVSYKNSKGMGFSTAVRDILTHVSLHGTNHRGQIAAAVRDAGDEPANTDFISFVREV